MIQQEQLALAMGWPISQPQASQLVNKYCTFLGMLEHYLPEGREAAPHQSR